MESIKNGDKISITWVKGATPHPGEDKTITGTYKGEDILKEGGRIILVDNNLQEKDFTTSSIVELKENSDFLMIRTIYATWEVRKVNK